jgi:hypothetical protein
VQVWTLRKAATKRATKKWERMKRRATVSYVTVTKAPVPKWEALATSK